MNDTALAFSGGKDSLACWYLCRHVDPYVIWVNTGKSYPETRKIIDMVREESNKFIEIKTNQAYQNKIHGLPSEIVPIDWTVDGMKVSGVKPIAVQSYLRCCWENISSPIMECSKKLGVKFLIRGQRLDESHKSTSVNFDIVNEITYLHPIENWTKDMVMELISRHIEIPEHFKLDHSSMDCYDCTAFLSQSIDRSAWTKMHWPELHVKYIERINQLKSSITPSLSAIDRIIAEG